MTAGAPVETGRGSPVLSRVSVRLPRGVESVDRVLERAGHGPFERRMFRRFHGLRDSPTLASGERMEDLLVGAGREALGGRGADVVLYGHSHVVQGFADRPGFARRLCAALGVPGAEFYGISQVHCVSVLRAVEVARRYHARPGARPGDRVLVLGGDQGSYDDSARIIPNVTVGGDAAAAVVVHAPHGRPDEHGEPGEHGEHDEHGDGTPRYRYLSGAALRDQRFHRALRMTQREQALYAKACMEHVTTVLREATGRAGFGITDLDWIMPDLTNAVFWRNFCRETGVERGRVPLDLLPLRGHNYGIDALSALQHADATGRLRPGDRCALVALGHGAYFQVVVVEVLGG
ncbi:3-oxoacyl-[acyl-carrier-protein] synthase III C-terminal domain-containing protein [Actinomadura rugatobispora]|uniref:3-oxoacyl-[acyl-carrier-protein] synthase III C-terminal domain-containing protein n=1 Tax=Actinomadura rugatobispora TaxID=1994 RepID=A0ABW0ZWI4_9ACTN|nr:ketoacyl-ACP synthase III [Actinomadura rugatobispora]